MIEVSGEERNGNRDGAGESRAHIKFALLTKFLRLLPISPLSTGLLPKILLPRLGSDVHGDQVIGTAVPASPRAGNGARVRQGTKGPISAGRPWAELSGSGPGQPGRS